MLQRIVLLTLLFLIVNNANAHTKIGVSAGVNTSWWHLNVNDDNTKIQNKYSLQGGVVTDFSFNKYLGLQTGIFYTGGGCKLKSSEISSIYNTDTTISTDKYDYTLRYLTLPVQLKIGKTIKETTKIYVMAGPYVSYLLSGKSHIIIDLSGKVTSDKSEKIEVGQPDLKGTGFSPIDYGIVAGAGVNFEGGMFLKTAYTSGFHKLNYNAYSFNWSDIKTRMLNISVGFFFNAKKKKQK